MSTIDPQTTQRVGAKIAAKGAHMIDSPVGKTAEHAVAGTLTLMVGVVIDDAIIVLEKAVPIALKKAKPGTKEFRAALRDAIETMGRTVFAHGVMNWTKDDHWGYTNETGVIVKVVNGDWKVE